MNPGSLRRRIEPRGWIVLGPPHECRNFFHENGRRLLRLERPLEHEHRHPGLAFDPQPCKHPSRLYDKLLCLLSTVQLHEDGGEVQGNERRVEGTLHFFGFLFDFPERLFCGYKRPKPSVNPSFFPSHSKDIHPSQTFGHIAPIQEEKLLRLSVAATIYKERDLVVDSCKSKLYIKIHVNQSEALSQNFERLFRLPPVAHV